MCAHPYLADALGHMNVLVLWKGEEGVTVAIVDERGLVPMMTEAEAREITDRAKQDWGDFVNAVKRLWRERGDLALGYAGWDDYWKAEFANTFMPSLPRAERVEAVRELRDEGMSTRAIGSALGVAQDTVNRDLAGERFRSPDPRPVTGIDGKTYTPKQPRTEGGGTSRLRSKHLVQRMAVVLSGLPMSLAPIKTLDDSLASEDAALALSEVEAAIKELRRIKKMLEERIER